MIQSQKKIFFPNLDGLRFMAFLGVFVNHAFGCLAYRNNDTTYKFIRERFLFGGDLGVNLFFVLSGFLITYLLLKEKEFYGKINILHFYVRRILRIWPVYFVVIIICIVFLPPLKEFIPPAFPISPSIDKLSPVLYVTFIGNFDYILHGITNVMIGVLWSVSVEEQFYLFWPLLVAFIPRKFLLSAFITIIAGSVAYRFFGSNGGHSMLLKYHSLSCTTYLATGAVLAYFSTKESFISIVAKTPRWLIIILYLMFLAIIPFRTIIWKFGAYYVHVASILPVILSLFFAFFIAEQNYALKSFYKFSRLKLISELGKYTYGMYCYHMMVFFFVLLAMHHSGINVNNVNKYVFTFELLISMLLTIVISKLSYRYFESPFLRLKDRYAHIVKSKKT
jgi:peptidoglycan/LPS O-acetylase OafA/YrhL